MIPFTHIGDMLLKPTGAGCQYDVVKCSVLNAVCDNHVQQECKHGSNQQTTATTADSKVQLQSTVIFYAMVNTSQ